MPLMICHCLRAERVADKAMPPKSSNKIFFWIEPIFFAFISRILANYCYGGYLLLGMIIKMKLKNKKTTRRRFTNREVLSGKRELVFIFQSQSRLSPCLIYVNDEGNDGEWYDLGMLKLEEIDKLAKLARLEILVEEKEILRKEVGEILEYVGQIQKLSPKEPPKEAGIIRNVFREDKNPHQTGEFTDVLLANAPEKIDSYIKVKKIL